MHAHRDFFSFRSLGQLETNHHSVAFQMTSLLDAADVEVPIEDRVAEPCGDDQSLTLTATEGLEGITQSMAQASVTVAAEEVGQGCCSGAKVKALHVGKGADDILIPFAPGRDEFAGRGEKVHRRGRCVHSLAA